MKTFQVRMLLPALALCAACARADVSPSDIVRWNLARKSDIPAPSAVSATNFLGSGAVLVAAGTNALANGAALLAAYAGAKALTPSGAALSASNRAAVILSPGTYSLGAAPLVLDARFVDLIGLTGDPAHVLITSACASNYAGTVVQATNSIRGAGLTLRNTASTRWHYDPRDAAAYMPAASCVSSVWENCVFDDNGGTSWSTGMTTNYNGTYIRCSAGYYGFGPQTVTGTFIGCTGGDSSFGLGANGTYTDCTGGINAFGRTDASGTFRNCTAGSGSFGCFTFSGTAINCTGGDQSFGNSSMMGSATATSRSLYCRVTSGTFRLPYSGGALRLCLNATNGIVNLP